MTPSPRSAAQRKKRTRPTLKPDGLRPANHIRNRRAPPSNPEHVPGHEYEPEPEPEPEFQPSLEPQGEPLSALDAATEPVMEADGAGAAARMLLTRLRLAAYKVQRGWEPCSWESIAALTQLPGYDDAGTQAKAAAMRRASSPPPLASSSCSAPSPSRFKATPALQTPRAPTARTLTAPLGSTPALVVASLSTPPASIREIESVMYRPLISPPRGSRSPAPPELEEVQYPPSPTPHVAPKRGSRGGDEARTLFPQSSASVSLNAATQGNALAAAPHVVAPREAPVRALPSLRALGRAGPKSYEDFWHRLSSATTLRVPATLPPLASPMDRPLPNRTSSPQPHT